MSTYILQKDISDPRFNIKSGTEFIKCNDAPDAAYVFGTYTLHPLKVENNPEWFKLKEEKIVIDGLRSTENLYTYLFRASKDIHSDKYDAICKAIEFIVNKNGVINDKKPYASVIQDTLSEDMFAMKSKYKYTEEDMRKCFERKRTQIVTVETKDGITKTSTSEQSFEDYINSLK